MRKKTKIVATISDKNCDVELIKELRKAGMNVVRLNTAHQTYEDTLKIIDNVRQVSERIALLLDTKGPEIRTTRAIEQILVKFGDMVKIKGDPEGITTKDCIYVNFKDFVADVPVGSAILIDDGDIELVAKEKEDDILLCELKTTVSSTAKKVLTYPQYMSPFPHSVKKILITFTLPLIKIWIL